MFFSYLYNPILSILIFIILLSGCGVNFEKMAEKRLAYAQKNQGDIEVVAIRSIIKTNYLKGVLLAAETINNRPNKLLGRRLKINIEQESATFNEGESTFRRIAANPKITAVIGHRRSSIAVPASVIYEQSNIIFFASFSTIQSLTGHNFNYVFRMSPSAETMAEQLASVAETLGYKKIIILYGRDGLNRELAFLFEDAAIRRKIKPVKRASFSSDNTNYRSLISQFSNDAFDAVFIAASSLPSAFMVKQLREMGVQQPILGSDSFNSSTFTDTLKDFGKNIIAPSFYNPNKKNIINQYFIKSYLKKYGQKPDYRAAQGYDSLMLLALGIERAGSTIPSLLASTFHYMPAWVGTTGSHKFSQDGDILGKKYFFKALENKQWRNLPAIHIPYLLERFYTESIIKDHPTEEGGDAQAYVDSFTQAKDNEEHKIKLLELSKEILKFKHIGIIYENTKNGREIVNYDLLKRFSKQTETTLLECKIPLSILTEQEREQQFFSCFGKLSLSMDALFLPVYHGVDQTMLQELSQSLAAFKIPTISLDPLNTNHISLLLNKRSDINLTNMNDMQIYNGLLNNIELNVFAKQLKNLPEISADLYKLQNYNISETPILQLSPSHYFDALPLIGPD
jgi:branched-chain amino acid transport system substrate-binding protein